MKMYLKVALYEWNKLYLVKCMYIKTYMLAITINN